MQPETVEEVLALLEVRPNDVKLYQILGGLYIKRRDVVSAWHAYMQALELNPDDPFTCLYFGNLLVICNEEKAMELYEHAVKADPNLAAAHWCKADLHKSLGEFGRANQEYERAVAVDPSDEQAQAKLAEWREFIAETRGS